MKVNVLLLVFICLMTLNLYGQNSSITGRVIYEKSLIAVDAIAIRLLDSLESVIRTEYTDSMGIYKIEEIESGDYQLLATSKNGRKFLFTGITIGIMEDVKLDIEIQDLCSNQYNTNQCPYCSSKKKVLKIDSGMVVSYNFGDNKSAIKRYDRKRKKSKFETYVNTEGKEVVIQMSIESEKEKFYDFCHNWFCKKCEKVY